MARVIAPPPIPAIASAVAGVQVKVFCRPAQLMDGDTGHVYLRGGVPDHVIYLDKGVCERLATPFAGFAALDMLVIAHEAEHIALASPNECLVERTALANVWQVIRRFRLPAARARWALTHAKDADHSLGAVYHPDANGAC